MQKEDFTSSSFTEPLYKCDHKRSKCDKCEHDHHDCGCHHHEHHCDCHHDIFPPNYHVIDNMCELKKLLSEVFVRFDNDPSAYQKDDFRVLLKVMAQSLIYLYKRDKNAVMSYRVDSLPALGEFGAIYIVPKPEEEQTEYNKFDEWLSLGECGWELIGGNAGEPQPVDFSGIESETLDVTVPEEGEPWKIELPEDIIELLNEVKQFAERIDALEAKAHVHENLDELDKIEEGDVEKWNQAALKSYDVVLAENEDFLALSSSTENFKTTFELSTSGIKELVKAEEERAIDAECRISDMASAAKTKAEEALGKVNVLDSKVTSLTTRVSAVERGLQTESETRASSVAELKADLALEMQNRADADTVLRQDINSNAQEIADLKARTLWVKKGDEDAVQVNPNENNEYIIPVPAACDCKLSTIYTSPYKIGGIEIGDQFGPGCELGDSFEDLVRRMLQEPPAPATLGYHYAWNVSCEWDDDEEEVTGGDILTLTNDILVDGVSLDAVENGAIPMTAFSEEGIAQKDTLTETYGFIVVLGRPDVNPTIMDLNGALGSLTKLKEIVAEDGNSYGVYIIPTIVSGPANGASYKNLTV